MRFLTAALNAFHVHNVLFRFIVRSCGVAFPHSLSPHSLAQSKYCVIERQLDRNAMENGSTNSVCM
jgi:hypothetical protein